MFPGWSRKLYGRKPRKKGILLRRKSEEIGALCLRQAKDLFGCLLGIQLLENVPGFRNRTFPLPVIFLDIPLPSPFKWFLPQRPDFGASSSKQVG